MPDLDFIVPTPNSGNGATAQIKKAGHNDMTVKFAQ